VIPTEDPGLPDGADGTSTSVGERTVAVTCWPPNRTVVSGAKLEPVMRTSPPPADAPTVGDTDAGTGGP